MNQDALQDVYFGEYIDFSEGHLPADRTDNVGENPVFSVMMTVYNDTSLLSSAICSCLRQDFPSWELLILDNSDKNDEAWAMIQNAVKYDSRIHAWRSEKNVGWPKGSSVLMKHAAGRYVTFLSADDCLAPGAFRRLYEEVEREEPDIIFVGNAYVNYEGGRRCSYLEECLPEYQVYRQEGRSRALVEIMQKVYYNSMFHYEKREFMEEHGMDFFAPYYADCATMTYAVTQADTIVVLDRIVYYLTMNTSQSAGHYGLGSYERIFVSQWRSAKSLFRREGYRIKTDLYYTAKRVFDNLIAGVSPLCGGECRDVFQNRVEVSAADIMDELEGMLASQEIGELFFVIGANGFNQFMENLAVFLNRPGWEEAAAGRCLHSLLQILRGDGMPVAEQLDDICGFLLHEKNPWCVGIYRFEELVGQISDGELRGVVTKVNQVLQKYETMLLQAEYPWLTAVLDA